MRRLLSVTATVGLFALAACTPAAPVGSDPSSAQPSSAPTPSAPTPSAPTPSAPTPSAPTSSAPTPSAGSSRTSPASVKPTKSPSPSSDPTDDGSVEEQGDEASEPTVSFKKAYSYPDGVQVEVTKVRHGTITARDVEAHAHEKKGAPWVQLSVRVKNGSKHRLGDLIGSFTLVYGSDGDEADPISVVGIHDSDLSGHISRGEAKICSSTFSVPSKDQDHVFLEFTADIDHDSILFSGSIA